MRILTRTLIMLAAALALGVLLAGPASAGTIDVRASISGAGTITEAGQIGYYTPPCANSRP